MKKHYQLLVIGAGPAGGYAAMTAARAGLEVLLVERNPEPGHRLACAEAISEPGLKRFIDPDPSFISTEIRAITITVSERYRETQSFPFLLGYIIHRPMLDRFLANLASKHGADLQTSTYAHSITLDDSGPARVGLKSDNGSHEVTADYVIACDGVESMIGRMAGLSTRLPLRQSDAALQYRVADIEIDPDNIEFCLGDKYAPEGYLWVFPKNDHEANVGLGMNPARHNNTLSLQKRLENFLKERYGRYTVKFTVCGMVPKFQGYDSVGRDNLFLAGDAARTVDSLTGAGIAKAMHTGQISASMVIRGIREGVPRHDLQKAYRRGINNEVGLELRFCRKLYPAFRKFTDDDWEALARFLKDFAKTKMTGSFIDPVSMVKSALFHSPRLIRLTRHLL